MNEDTSPEDRIRSGARRSHRTEPVVVAPGEAGELELETWAEELQRTTIDALQAMGDLVRVLEERITRLEGK